MVDPHQLNRIRDQCFTFSIPIYTNRRDAPLLVGTGFFLEWRERVIFATAGHVIERVRDEDFYIYLSRKIALPLTGTFFSWQTSESGEDRDVGFLRFHEDLRLNSEFNHPVLRTDQLAPALLPKHNLLYGLFGYPSSRSKTRRDQKSVQSEVLSFGCRGADPTLYSANGLNEQSHILMPYPENDARIAATGAHYNMPSPQGMSGSPMWVIGYHREKIDLPAPRVAGVFTTYRKSQSLAYGTDVVHLLEHIERNIDRQVST